MMSTFLKRASRAIWSFRQPLTILPTIPSTPLSDLFLWRNSDDWETYFELTDMIGMFGKRVISDSDVSAELVFFDHLGREIGEKSVSAPLHKRKLLSIRELLGEGHSEMGTFCVLHKKTPDCIKDFGSSLAERGYVSFRYRRAPLMSYLHGNLDAVAKGPDGRVERLGGASLLLREYRLQYELCQGRKYEIAIVNSSPKHQKVVFELLDGQLNSRIVSATAAELSSGGCYAFTIIPEQKSARVLIRSRLVMARPIVFSYSGDSVDALHG